jgi:erythromycin esterase-like protein
MNYSGFLAFLFVNVITVFTSTASVNDSLKFQVNRKILSGIPSEVKLLALGDPTHFEGTITTHRIDLIKRLVKEQGYQSIAFESGFFSMYVANKKFAESGNPQVLFDVMPGLYPCEELLELFEFIETENEKGNPIQLSAFDVKLTGKNTFEDLKEYLESFLQNKDVLSPEEKADYYELLEKLIKYSSTDWNMKKEQLETIRLYTEKILANNSSQTIEEKVLQQTLKNILSECDRLQMSGMEKANKRDLAMAENMLFLQETFGNQKTILWGSSTHFIKNPKGIQTDFFQNNRLTFGEKLKEVYQKKYHFLAYSALNGKQTLQLFKKKIRTPKEGSIEYIALQEKAGSDFFISLTNYSEQKLHIPEVLNSRILGHNQQLMNVREICDGIVFVSDCEPYNRLK